MPSYKLSILEKDGEEYEFPVEHDAEALISSLGFVKDPSNASVFGTELDYVKIEEEHATTSDEWQTVFTHTTSDLPLGDYIYFLNFGVGHSKKKITNAELLLDAAIKASFYEQSSRKAGVGEYSYQHYMAVLENISGYHTFSLRHKNESNGLARLGDVNLVLFRVS